MWASAASRERVSPRGGQTQGVLFPARLAGIASERIEQLILAEKKLYANVDFYSASMFYSRGIAIDLYTPIFAVSRISGWTAHVLEQYKDNRLFPLDQR